MKTWLGTLLMLAIAAGPATVLAAPKRGPVIVITERDLVQARTVSVVPPLHPAVLVVTDKDLPRDEDYSGLPTLDPRAVEPPPLAVPPSRQGTANRRSSPDHAPAARVPLLAPVRHALHVIRPVSVRRRLSGALHRAERRPGIRPLQQ